MLIKDEYTPGISRTGNEFETKRKFQPLKKITTLEGKIVLDIGCGLGGYSIAAAKSDAKYVIGLDLDIQRLRKGKELVKKYDSIDLIKAVAEYLPFRNGTGDIVILIEAIEHVEKEDVCLSEVYRTLKTDGTILISAPNKFYLFETHGIKISKTQVDNIFGVGIPFLSWAPKILRKKLERARIYSQKDLTMLLVKYGFNVYIIDWMMPPLDSMVGSETQKFFLREVLKKIEMIPFLKYTGSSVIVVAKPVHA